MINEQYAIERLYSRHGRRPIRNHQVEPSSGNLVILDPNSYLIGSATQFLTPPNNAEWHSNAPPGTVEWNNNNTRPNTVKWHTNTTPTIVLLPSDVPSSGVYNKPAITSSSESECSSESDSDSDYYEDSISGDNARGIRVWNKIKGKNPRRRFRLLALFFFSGMVLDLAIFDLTAYSVLDSQFQLNPGNLFIDYVWTDVPVPFKLQIFLYSIENSKQFLDGAPPHLTEHGPWVFNINRHRRVLEWTDKTVIFKESYTAEFDELSSNGTMQTPLRMLNTPIFAVSSWAYYWMKKFNVEFLNPVVHNVLTVALQAFGERLIEERPAKDILMGRPINALKFLDSLAIPFRAVNIPIPNYISIFTVFGEYALVNLSFSIIGIFTGNEFGPIEHYRHNEDNHKVNEISNINGEDFLRNYKPPCNRIHGVDPMYYGLQDQGEQIVAYQQHFCRTLVFNKNITHWFAGVRAIRYQVDEQMFSMRKQEYRCYCFERTLPECEGYTDLSGCFGGLPLGLSHPHFLGTPFMSRRVLGMHPDRQKHLTYLEIEPNMGLPFYNHLAFQYNLILRNFPRIGQLSRVQQPTLIPFFSFVATVTSIDTQFHYPLMIGSLVLNYGKYFLAFCAAFLFVLFLGLSFMY